MNRDVRSRVTLAIAAAAIAASVAAPAAAVAADRIRITVTIGGRRAPDSGDAAVDAHPGDHIRITAETPDDQLADMRVQWLPDGPDSRGGGLLEWTFARSELGTHRLIIVATSGAQTARRSLTVNIVDNRPPTIDIVHPPQLQAEQDLELNVVATDPDADDRPTAQVENLPRGATFDPERHRIMWRPHNADAGAHVVTAIASDGQATTRRDITLIVVPEWANEHWESELLPGVRYSFYAPVGSQTLGYMHGVSLELVPYAWVHRSENRGPSHGRLFARGDILRSTHGNQGVTFIYGFGFDLSFERDPQRRVLIPFFGLDMGGAVVSGIGHRFQMTPQAGVHLFSSRNVFVDVTGGYMLTPSALQELRGWRALAGANVTFW